MTEHQPLAEQVGTEVRVLLLRQRRSQADLARALELSPAAIGRRLTGEVPFDVNELEAIADMLGVPLATFLPADPAKASA